MARGLASHRKLAKVVDSDRFSLLKGSLEELKDPIQQRDRLCFGDPSFLMNALSNVRLMHLVSLPLRLLSILRQEIMEGLFDQFIKAASLAGRQYLDFNQDILGTRAPTWGLSGRGADFGIADAMVNI